MEGLIYIFKNWHSSGFLNNFFKIVTTLGDAGIFWIVLGLVFLSFKKTRICGIVMFVSLGIGFVLNDFVLKSIIARPRPFEANPEFKKFILSIGMDLPSGFSMPSGHAYSSFNCATIITLFLKKKGAFSYIIAFLIAFSRIFMCVHYPTDVLLGAVLGILTATICYVVYRAVMKKIKFCEREKVRKLNV